MQENLAAFFKPFERLAMDDSVSLLLLEFLRWVASRPRTYAEAMDAWRTSCPRQSVWEDALLDGLIAVESVGRAGDAAVKLTARGIALLRMALIERAE